MKEFISKHFKLEKVTEGIYAAIAKDGGGAIGNAGFIDLGDKTIIFDTFNTQQAAEDLKNVAEKFTGRPVSWVINSHWHGDHIRGNQIFRDCNIIASRLTSHKMQEIHPKRMKKQKDDVDGLKNYIQTLQDQLKNSNEKKLADQIDFLNELALSLLTLELVLPQYTFHKEFTIYGSERTAELSTLGGGHSHCDTILYIPEEEIIFMGDLLFVDTHPTFFPESNPNEWKSILSRLKEKGIKKAIPGHGPVGTKEDILTLMNYIIELENLSREDRVIEAITISTDFAGWASPQSFYQSIKRLKELSEGTRGGI